MVESEYLHYKVSSLGTLGPLIIPVLSNNGSNRVKELVRLGSCGQSINFVVELEIDKARAHLEDPHDLFRVLLLNNRLRINLHDELLEWIIKVHILFIKKFFNKLL